MPRLRPELFHRARSIHALLPLVLRATRDLRAAQNELRWMTEYAVNRDKAQNRSECGWHGWRNTLRQLCHQRARGKPLQYLLGEEYFGDLEIICQPGVLIPRQETAVSVSHLVRKLVKPPEDIRVLDLCTGTGCIPLLFSHEFNQRHPRHQLLRFLGIDLSPKAVRLAETNLERQMRGKKQMHSIEFAMADVFGDDEVPDSEPVRPLMPVLRDSECVGQSPRWDILISNPPYISPEAFNHTTSRSVRNYEPRLALVPGEQYQQPSIDPGDVFYPRLLDIAQQVNAKIVLFEVADLDQAQRVASMVHAQSCWAGVEIWRDDPESRTAEYDDSELAMPSRSSFRIVGSGNGRSVFAWRREAEEWLG